MNVLFFFILSFWIEATHAMDAFEYQIYDAEIDKVGDYSLETHLNIAGSKTSAGETAELLPANHLTHLTFEFAHGMTPNWELGAYFQTALSPNGIYRYAGAKLRSKFVWIYPGDKNLKFGLNFEISDVPPQFESERWGSEVRPIITYAWWRFIFLFNPIVDVTLSAGASAAPDLSPAAKMIFDMNRGYGLGFEYYTEFGEVNKLEPIAHAEQYLLAVYDLLNGPVELNLGAGPGLNSASNEWLAKGIFGFVF